MKKSLREEVLRKYGDRCAYCGSYLEYKKMQVDHYFPQHNPMLAKTNGMADVDDIENLMPSCRRCNHYKGSLMPENFRKRMNSLHERIANLYIVKVALDYGIVKIKPFNNKFYFEMDECDAHPHRHAKDCEFPAGGYCDCHRNK